MADTAVAIVTGGAQGLGAAFCTALLKKGFKVCIADVQEDKGKSFVEELQQSFGSENVIFSLCDVTKEEDYQRTFDLTVSSFHKVDILINNAGICLEQNPAKALQVNLLGPIIGCQTALKCMGKSHGGEGGIVINMASILGFLWHPLAPTYTATKHGIIGLTRSYGHPYHFNKNGVVFTALCPSFADTPLVRKSENCVLDSKVDLYKPMHLLSPDYIAQGMLKLLEDRINGSTLLVTKENGFQYVGYQDDLKNTWECKVIEETQKKE